MALDSAPCGTPAGTPARPHRKRLCDYVRDFDDNLPANEQGYSPRNAEALRQHLLSLKFTPLNLKVCVECYREDRYYRTRARNSKAGGLIQDRGRTGADFTPSHAIQNSNSMHIALHGTAASTDSTATSTGTHADVCTTTDRSTVATSVNIPNSAAVMDAEGRRCVPSVTGVATATTTTTTTSPTSPADAKTSGLEPGGELTGAPKVKCVQKVVIAHTLVAALEGFGRPTGGYRDEDTITVPMSAVEQVRRLARALAGEERSERADGVRTPSIVDGLDVGMRGLGAGRAILAHLSVISAQLSMLCDRLDIQRAECPRDQDTRPQANAAALPPVKSTVPLTPSPTPSPTRPTHTAQSLTPIPMRTTTAPQRPPGVRTPSVALAQPESEPGPGTLLPPPLITDSYRRALPSSPAVARKKTQSTTVVPAIQVITPAPTSAQTANAPSRLRERPQGVPASYAHAVGARAGQRPTQAQAQLAQRHRGGRRTMRSEEAARIIVRFTDCMPERRSRMDPRIMRDKVNRVLAHTRTRVGGVQFTRAGNIVITPVAPSTVEELLQHTDAVKECLAHGQSSNTLVVETDAAWPSVVVKNVRMPKGESVWDIEEELCKELGEWNPCVRQGVKEVRVMCRLGEIRGKVRGSVRIAFASREGRERAWAEGICAFGERCQMVRYRSGAQEG
jgi:hypothetical protein